MLRRKAAKAAKEAAKEATQDDGVDKYAHLPSWQANLLRQRDERGGQRTTTDLGLPAKGTEPKRQWSMSRKKKAASASASNAAPEDDWLKKRSLIFENRGDGPDDAGC